MPSLTVDHTAEKIGRMEKCILNKVEIDISVMQQLG